MKYVPYIMFPVVCLMFVIMMASGASTNQQVVPDVIGMELSIAQETLTAAGFIPEIVVMKDVDLVCAELIVVAQREKYQNRGEKVWLLVDDKQKNRNNVLSR